jgi:transcriptional regulator with XRE-family HTH domain
MTDTHKAFSAHLKKLRKERKSTQLDFAVKADIPLSLMTRYETGKVLPGLLTLIKIAKTLNIPAGEILNF